MAKQLEDRFQNYAKAVRDFCALIVPDLINAVYIRQVIRSSSSISANYAEASDDIGKADEKMKIKIARRETKETIKWLDLILITRNPTLEQTRATLIDEGEQIKKILSAIIIKLEKK
jgi:four helix bundle protein